MRGIQLPRGTSVNVQQLDRCRAGGTDARSATAHQYVNVGYQENSLPTSLVCGSDAPKPHRARGVVTGEADATSADVARDRHGKCALRYRHRGVQSLAPLREQGPSGSGPHACSRRRKTRDVHLSRLHAHLREEAEQRTFHGPAPSDSQAIAGEAEGSQGRTQTTCSPT